MLDDQACKLIIVHIGGDESVRLICFADVIDMIGPEQHADAIKILHRCLCNKHKNLRNT